MCDASEGTPLQRLAAFNLLYLKKEGRNTTYASHSGFINWMKMSGWNAPSVTNGSEQGRRGEEKGSRREEIKEGRRRGGKGVTRGKEIC